MLKGYLLYVAFVLCIVGTIIDGSRAAVYFARGQLSGHFLTVSLGIFFTVMVLLIVFYPVKNTDGQPHSLAQQAQKTEG